MLTEGERAMGEEKEKYILRKGNANWRFMKNRVLYNEVIIDKYPGIQATANINANLSTHHWVLLRTRIWKRAGKGL